MSKVGFILGKHGQFNIEKSLWVIYSTKRLKEKIVFWKSQCSFMLKKNKFIANQNIKINLHFLP